MKPLRSVQAPHGAPVLRSRRSGALLLAIFALLAALIGAGAGVFLLSGGLRAPEPPLVVNLEARLASRGIEATGHAGLTHDSNVDLDAVFTRDDSRGHSGFRLRRFTTPASAQAKHCYQECIVHGRHHLEFVEWPAAERPKVREALLALPQ